MRPARGVLGPRHSVARQRAGHLYEVPRGNPTGRGGVTSERQNWQEPINTKQSELDGQSAMVRSTHDQPAMHACTPPIIPNLISLSVQAI
ncbi:hypothetical protein Psta_1844 [Pirellula staleyi DSM 6068]|uniref:Uncharacterized protein n=1 Tax=Pirellula staleyi (strain ATCC 27377 / DSM 6068 / ICPB 4128) TaxID=530564 RepID=D2QZN5_PIRSD|nr:hypothetical protein Psta_1844 [Pirellula staleyi DSM 6068]